MRASQSAVCRRWPTYYWESDVSQLYVDQAYCREPGVGQLYVGQAHCRESDVSKLYVGLLWGIKCESVVCRPTVGNQM